MGYYSDIGLALAVNGVTELHKRLDDMGSNSQTRQDILGFLSSAEHHYTDTETKAEVWYWKSVKWYIGDPKYYPEVDFVESMLADLDEDDFRFIRIGDDYDDTEVRGYFWDNPFDLELARSITIKAP